MSEPRSTVPPGREADLQAAVHVRPMPIPMTHRSRMNIYLIGFSGTGKTLSGMRAASALGWDFFEMDDRIEHRERRKISRVFEEDGEEYFRRVETDVLKEAADSENTVVSTGGGVPTREENTSIMSNSGVIIRLIASPETIHARLSRAAGSRNRALRPLLGDQAPVDTIRDLLASREQAYSIADAIIDTENKTHDEVSREIVENWARLTGNKSR